MTIRTFISAAWLALAAGPALAEEPAAGRPVVVELFTSQGCSSCPAANAVVGRLAARDGVLPLSVSVDYWDYLGWRDTFAKPEFTARQRGYSKSLLNRHIYTPQMVVDGARDVMGRNEEAVTGAIAERRGTLPEGPSLNVGWVEQRLSIAVGAGDAPRRGADVWLVAFTPGEQDVPVARGENRGRKVAHFNVVTGIERLGGWTGAEARFEATAPASGAAAILVQTAEHGPVLSAAEIRRPAEPLALSP